MRDIGISPSFSGNLIKSEASSVSLARLAREWCWRYIVITNSMATMLIPPPPIWDRFKGIIPGGCGAKEVEGACHRKGRRYRQRRVGAPTPLPQRKQRRRRPKVHRDTRNPSSNLIDNDPDPPSRSSSSLNFWINCQLNRQNRSTRAQKHTHERTPAARRLSDWSSARHVSYGSQDGDHRMQQQYND